jgi:hypothetical protein
MFAPPNGTAAGLAMQQRFGDVWRPVVTSVLVGMQGWLKAGMHACMHACDELLKGAVSC